MLYCFKAVPSVLSKRRTSCFCVLKVMAPLDEQKRVKKR